jgi:hypothetical protein
MSHIAKKRREYGGTHHWVPLKIPAPFGSSVGTAPSKLLKKGSSRNRSADRPSTTARNVPTSEGIVAEDRIFFFLLIIFFR